MIFASQAPGSRAADLTVVFDFPQTTTIGVSFTIAAVVVAGSVGEGWFLHTSETAAWWESTGLIGRTVGGIRVRCKQFQVSELPRVITLSLRESNGSDILTYVLAVPIGKFGRKSRFLSL